MEELEEEVDQEEAAADEQQELSLAEQAKLAFLASMEESAPEGTKASKKAAKSKSASASSSAKPKSKSKGKKEDKMPDSFERAFKYIIKYVIVAHYFLDSYVAIKDISPEVMTPDQADLTALAVKWEQLFLGALQVIAEPVAALRAKCLDPLPDNHPMRDIIALSQEYLILYVIEKPQKTMYWSNPIDPWEVKPITAVDPKIHVVLRFRKAANAGANTTTESTPEDVSIYIHRTGATVIRLLHLANYYCEYVTAGLVDILPDATATGSETAAVAAAADAAKAMEDDPEGDPDRGGDRLDAVWRLVCGSDELAATPIHKWTKGATKDDFQSRVLLLRKYFKQLFCPANGKKD